MVTQEMRSKVERLNISKNSTFIIESGIDLFNVSVYGYDQKGAVLQDKQHGKLAAPELGIQTR